MRLRFSCFVHIFDTIGEGRSEKTRWGNENTAEVVRDLRGVVETIPRNSTKSSAEEGGELGASGDEIWGFVIEKPHISRIIHLMLVFIRPHFGLKIDRAILFLKRRPKWRDAYAR